MKVCPQCHAEYDDTKKFCRHDGNPLEEKTVDGETAEVGTLTCPECSKPIETGKKFCRHCGARLENETQFFVTETEPTVPSPPQPEQLLEAQCPSCSAPIISGQKFCRVCGANLALSTSFIRATIPTASRQLDAERETQILLLQVAEKRRQRRETRGRITRSIGLGTVVILFIMGGIFGYRKLQGRHESPAPSLESPASVNKGPEVLPGKDLPSSPSSEVVPPTPPSPPSRGGGGAIPSGPTPSPAGTSTQPGQPKKITITTKTGGALQVNDFRATASEITGDNNVVIVDKKEYSIVYYTPGQWFTISILDANVQAARSLAEEDFLKYLGITKDQACTLNVTLAVAPYANEIFAGRDYRLSFCPDGLPLIGRQNSGNIINNSNSLDKNRPDELIPSSSSTKSPMASRPDLAPGRYEVIRTTPVLQEPHRTATALARLYRGKKVKVVGSTGQYARVESTHNRPPGYVLREDIIPLQTQ